MQKIFKITQAGQIIINGIDSEFLVRRNTGRPMAAISILRTIGEPNSHIARFALGLSDDQDIAKMVQRGQAEWLEIDELGD